jgi:hypothetical protein
MHDGVHAVVLRRAGLASVKRGLNAAKARQTGRKAGPAIARVPKNA